MDWDTWVAVLVFLLIAQFRAVHGPKGMRWGWWVVGWPIMIGSICRGFYEENPAEHWLAAVLLVVALVTVVRQCLAWRAARRGREQTGTSAGLGKTKDLGDRT